MKNIQTIDGAENCTFSIFQATDEEFAWLFPEPGQDIQFAEDIVIPEGKTMMNLWERPIRKQDAMGIHGTIFYEFAHKRHHFPTTRREQDWAPSSINAAQRAMYAAAKLKGSSDD
jgi:hypothetical protein